MSVEQKCKDWPFAWFGFFTLGNRTEPPPPPYYLDLPKVTDFIDQNWNYPQLTKLTEYLRKHEEIIALELRQTPCLLCREKHSPSRFHWDGTWLWPTSLSHYVEVHAVRLPDRMLRNLEERDFISSADTQAIPFEKLPWPKVKPRFRFSVWLKSLMSRGVELTFRYKR